MPESKGTKFILAQALKTLMSAKPFSKISVGDICEQCSVSRKSFYYHFQDKYDLMNWIFYVEFIGTIHPAIQTDGAQLLHCICAYFYQEQHFYRNALSVHGQNSFQEYFMETIEPFVLVLIQDLIPDHEEIPFFVTFYTDALLASLIRWLNEGARIPPEKYAQLLMKTIYALQS